MKGALRAALRLAGPAALLVGLPLAGLLAAGRPVADHLEFPPRTRYVEPAPFSWPVFAAGAAFALAVLAPFAVRVARGRGREPEAGSRRSEVGGPRARVGPAVPEPGSQVPGSGSPARAFPPWGWAGVALGVAAWVLAWTRTSGFAPWQRHTFTPLWLAYIVVANALLVRRTGRSPLTDAPGRYLALFPASALFWWFFEYLNRFVQNWHYVGIGDMGAAEYVLLATLPFSTVLPAVLATERLLATWPRLTAGLDPFAALRPPRRPAAALALAAAAAGLAGVGVWPSALFPLLWVAPLLVLLGLDALAGRPHVLEPIARGSWTAVARWALAALVCGFFWEMWNAGSLAKWVYTIPHVGRFKLFEMPILGYTGYLPFGLECAWLAARLGWTGTAPLNAATAPPTRPGRCPPSGCA